jgi:hypothetical protein
MPSVSQTSIPQGYPYLTVTSDADYTKPLKTKKKTNGTTSLETALAQQRREMDRKFHITLNEIVQEGNEREQQKKANQREMGTMTADTGRASTLVADAIAETRTKEEPMKELKGESKFLTKPDLKTPSQQLSLLKSKIVAGTTKQFPPVASQQAIVRATTGTQAGPSLTTTEVQTEAPTRMTTEAQTNLIEYVGAGTQATKETREMATETEPLLVTVAKGAKADIFNIMKEQEATGKVLSLTGAGRPARPFSESLALASPSPSPVRVPAPVPVASLQGPVGSASSSSGVEGYTEMRPARQGSVTNKGRTYTYDLPARIVQMPPEVIDLS